ncbi:hypothetical protein EZV62_009071 [Acer yangbiense]|uniref:Cyclic nucleotide-binding domain-containing protein n=1 Tax=Acer yangbiense TaxID=1000413 RepID=A0A5C7IH74_9ROSI|nr:hypothetical protein EZV62_009071 [Acer yangbiense]
MFTRATRTWATLAKATWAKAAFNLLLYIHGAHWFWSKHLSKYGRMGKYLCDFHCHLRHGVVCLFHWKYAGGVVFGNLVNNLPDDLKRNIKRQLYLELLMKVEEFRTWSTELLHELCDCAKPVSYTEHAEIVRRGSSIDEMLFLVQGKLHIYSLTSVDTGSAASPPCFEISINHLEDSEFCGEELVAWFQASLYSSNLPVSTRIIQTTTKVDAFALIFYNLQNVFIKHQTSTQVQKPPAESQPPQVPPPPAESLAQQPTSGI